MVNEKTKSGLLTESFVSLRNQLDFAALELGEQKIKLRQAEKALLLSDKLRNSAEEALQVSEKRRSSEHEDFEAALRLSEELRKHTDDALKLSEERRIEDDKQARNSLNRSEELRNQATEALKMSDDLRQLAYDKIARLEKEIVRLDRIDIVGKLAAGISHEVRNPMTTVRGFLQLLGGKEELLKYKENFKLMIEELDRANSIITEFLSLVKNKEIELKLVNLNTIIKNLLPLIEADAIKSDKYIKAELGIIADLLMDEREIRQIILNLVRNGLDAMLPSGYITIKTFTDNEDIVLAVQDQGKGISPDVYEKIGTPFFTTKENGTGLGLSICYNIAKKYNAKIDIETCSTGTTFFVRFNVKLAFS